MASQPRTSPSVLRVFLSSTDQDLAAHWQAVRDIVGRLGQFTLAMEHFDARAGDVQTVSTALVAECDLYLGIVAWRNGYLPAVYTHSMTQPEYAAAVRLGIPACSLWPPQRPAWRMNRATSFPRACVILSTSRHSLPSGRHWRRHRWWLTSPRLRISR
jgi:hypothetical protein